MQTADATIILHRLLVHLTLWQAARLLDELDRVIAEGGYGKVSIVIERGHTRRIETYVSLDITPVQALQTQKEKPHGQT